MAGITFYEHIGKEMHLDLDDAVSRTGFTPAPFDIKTEPAFIVSSGLRVCRLSKQIPDQIKYPCISGRIGSGRPSDRALIDVDHFIQLVCPFNAFMPAGDRSGSV